MPEPERSYERGYTGTSATSGMVHNVRLKTERQVERLIEYLALKFPAGEPYKRQVRETTTDIFDNVERVADREFERLLRYLGNRLAEALNSRLK